MERGLEFRARELEKLVCWALERINGIASVDSPGEREQCIQSVGGKACIRSGNARAQLDQSSGRLSPSQSGRILNGSGEPEVVFNPENGVCNLRGSIIWWFQHQRGPISAPASTVC